MTATYTFDIFMTLDGFGSYDEHGDWGGYWGKQGPELEERRLRLYDDEQRMVFGATTYRDYIEMLGASPEEIAVSGVADTWAARMVSLPATVISNTLQGPLEWPNATVASGDAVDIVEQLKKESDVPLRSHGSLSVNRALMAAGLVDFLQVTVFPVISGRTGTEPILQGADDFDLDLVEQRTLDGRTIELLYRPSLHG